MHASPPWQDVLECEALLDGGLRWLSQTRLVAIGVMVGVVAMAVAVVTSRAAVASHSWAASCAIVVGLREAEDEVARPPGCRTAG